MNVGQQRMSSPPGGGMIREAMLAMGGYFNPFRMWGIIPLWIKLFVHRRLPLIPTRIEGREEIGAIRARIKEMEEG